jgi:hypothetical protein
MNQEKPKKAEPWFRCSRGRKYWQAEKRCAFKRTRKRRKRRGVVTVSTALVIVFVWWPCFLLSALLLWGGSAWQACGLCAGTAAARHASGESLGASLAAAQNLGALWNVQLNADSGEHVEARATVAFFGKTINVSSTWPIVPPAEP